MFFLYCSTTGKKPTSKKTIFFWYTNWFLNGLFFIYFYNDHFFTCLSISKANSNSIDKVNYSKWQKITYLKMIRSAKRGKTSDFGNSCFLLSNYTRSIWQKVSKTVHFKSKTNDNWGASLWYWLVDYVRWVCWKTESRFNVCGLAAAVYCTVCYYRNITTYLLVLL